MSRTIKAIETQYKGYRFRSRLEARWAVFFDALGIEWEYEPEGYDLGEAGWYLPDFWFPQFQVWGEVKARDLEFIELEKCYALSKMTGNIVLLLIETPSPDCVWSAFYPKHNDRLRNSNTNEISCETDGGYPGGDFDEHIPNSKLDFRIVLSSYSKAYPQFGYTGAWNIEMAVKAARSARFEHGETPQ